MRSKGDTPSYAFSGTPVVVKVQYPEVADYYEADFDNLETLTK